MNSRHTLHGSNLLTAVRDPAITVSLADEHGMIPAVWGIGSGYPGITRIRQALDDRAWNPRPADSGIVNSDGSITVIVAANDTLPPILRQHVARAEI